MKDIEVLAEVTFSEVAKRFFNFPMTDSTRMSFWIYGDGKSTFSEILYDGVKIEVDKPIIIRVKYFEQEFLIGRIGAGSLFSLGTFPLEIANGRIVDWDV